VTALDGTHVAMTTDAVGGVWRYAADAAAGLVSRGLRVTLIGLGPGPSHAQSAEAEAAGAGLRWLDARLDWTLGDEAAAAALAADLAALVRATGADLVHLNTPALAVAADEVIPRVVAAHSCLATWWRAVRGTPPPPEWDWHRRMTGRGLARAAVALAPSAAFAAALGAVYGAQPALRIVHNGAVPIAALPRDEAVLAAGRWWDPAKNAAALDAAAASVHWPVLAAGPRQSPSGESIATRHLRHLGPLAPLAMAERTARAPIFVSVSLYEPFGLSVLEAATAGAALVLADIPTFRELWGGSARFVDPTDPGAIARAVNGLIGDPALRRQFGDSARRRARDYTLDAQVDALLDAYAAALQYAPRRAPALA
jgi:glycosyltransferase involved in cell wall biosynthesis